ncbi:hypothetical protein U9M48_010751 [Paspalum notatum var. saurae]|uniref:Uncharacterized protein n=1 Tax=Paspalum notatum var. saurae TaxID=547442 RepID=A0AAQ3SU87_PASNO
MEGSTQNRCLEAPQRYAAEPEKKPNADVAEPGQLGGHGHGGTAAALRRPARAAGSDGGEASVRLPAAAGPGPLAANLIVESEKQPTAAGGGARQQRAASRRPAASSTRRRRAAAAAAACGEQQLQQRAAGGSSSELQRAARSSSSARREAESKGPPHDRSRVSAFCCGPLE